jgi:hypothetical protein
MAAAQAVDPSNNAGTGLVRFGGADDRSFMLSAPGSR